MNAFRKYLKGLTRFTVVMFMTANLYAPASQASMVLTGTVVSHAQAEQQRAALNALLARQDVRSELQSLGVDPANAQERVAALSDQEVAQLSNRISSLPAGGHGYDIFNYAWVLLVVLLITDLLGLTNVFGFHKHKTDN